MIQDDEENCTNLRPVEAWLRPLLQKKESYKAACWNKRPFNGYWPIKLAYSHPLLIPNLLLPLFETIVYKQPFKTSEYTRVYPVKSDLIWILPASLYANGRITSYASWPAVAHSVSSNSFPSTLKFYFKQKKYETFSKKVYT